MLRLSSFAQNQKRGREEKKGKQSNAKGTSAYASIAKKIHNETTAQETVTGS